MGQPLLSRLDPEAALGTLSRRSVLRAGAAGVATLALGGCAAGPPRPGRRAEPGRPEGTDLLPAVEHILVLMMENHSFDNYLGALGRGDGFTLAADGRPAAVNLDATGRPVRAFRMPSTCQLPRQPSQTWNASHLAYHGGRNDGFVRGDSGPVAMGYWTGQELPFYYALARTFPLADRYFASLPGGTYPNRRFLLAGTSWGQVSDVTPTRSDPPPPNGTIFDRLDAHRIPWRNYYASLPTVDLVPYVALRDPDNLLPLERFFADAAAGRLPGFAIIDPDFQRTSEENPQDILAGQAFAARVVDAVLHSPAWPRTLLVWCYDEHGGYYDHVPPPPAVAPDAIPPAIRVPPDQPGSFDRYGFRVPCVVVSPWARLGYVSRLVHDHTSILKLVETKWNLSPLTRRDAAASNLLDCLDFRRPAFLDPPRLPAPPPAMACPTLRPPRPGTAGRE